MFRKTVGKQIENKNTQFRLRGKEILRIEAFTDAVFAFAITLLIVSLEVPQTFNELLAVMKGFLAFAISFAILMEIWFEQNVFFRRYGLHDVRTIWLNGLLIFTVLFYVYPLKFLFSLMTGGFVHGESTPKPVFTSESQIPQLMYIYGTGYVLVYFILLLMYLHANAKREELELNEIEKFDTKTKMFSLFILISVGLVVLFVAAVVNNINSGQSGMIYFLNGPALGIFHTKRGKIRRKKFEIVS